MGTRGREGEGLTGAGRWGVHCRPGQKNLSKPAALGEWSILASRHAYCTVAMLEDRCCKLLYRNQETTSILVVWINCIPTPRARRTARVIWAREDCDSGLRELKWDNVRVSPHESREPGHSRSIRDGNTERENNRPQLVARGRRRAQGSGAPHKNTTSRRGPTLPRHPAPISSKTFFALFGGIAASRPQY